MAKNSLNSLSRRLTNRLLKIYKAFVKRVFAPEPLLCEVLIAGFLWKCVRKGEEA